MAREYQTRAQTTIISGGYSGEEVGVDPVDTGWQNRTFVNNTDSGTSTYSYFYRDSDYLTNARSSRVVLNITDAWTATVDGRNNVTIEVTTTLNSVVRDSVIGYPGGGLRSLYARRESGGAVLWQHQNDRIDSAHTILSSAVGLGTYSFTLAPGEEAQRGSVYFLNAVPGHESDPLPSIYVDALWIGKAFKNILPADYRPGQVWDGARWLSHNRDGGAANIQCSGSWVEMRTVAGGEGTDNPPLIYHPAGWRNQREIGAE